MRKQRWAIWIGVTIIALMGLCPPWMEAYRYGAARFIGYAPIFAPPKSATAGIDMMRLFLQWFTVAVAVGTWMATAERRKSNGAGRQGRGISRRGILLGVLGLFFLASAAAAIIAQERWDDAVAAVAFVLFLRFGILFVLQLRRAPISGTADRDPLKSLV